MAGREGRIGRRRIRRMNADKPVDDSACCPGEGECGPALSSSVDDHARGVLVSSGLRKTHARLAVLGLLLRAARPLSATEIAEQLAGGHVDLVTIYRTLTSLEQARAVVALDLGDRVRRYECLSGRDSHGHFVCRLCGDVACLPADAMLRNVDLVASYVAAGYRLERERLVLEGLCPQCSAAADGQG